MLPLRLSSLLLAILLAGPLAAQVPVPADDAPGITGQSETGDADYLRVLKAYRGQLTREQLAVLDQRDPVPSLYMGPKTPAERELTRFFAALPDEAHAELQRLGYLKWPVEALPAEQLRRLRGIVKRLEGQRQGPFPLEPRSGTVVGLARVDVEGLAVPQYSWWIAGPGVKRPSWITLVRAVGLLLEVHFTAHDEQLPPLLDRSNSSPIPPEKWVRLKDLRPEPEPEIPLPTVIDAEYYRDCLRAYRGHLKGAALEALKAEDSLVARRLASKDDGERSLNRFFARLTEREHQELLTAGLLAWRAEALTKEQRSLLQPVVDELNRRARLGGEARDLYNLVPYAQSVVGLAVIPIPGADRPVVSWWIRSAFAPHPAWITLLNGEAVGSPDYFRAHLEALGGR